MANKVTLKIDKADGKAVIIEGQNTFVGKILASKGKIKINSPIMRRELNIKPE